MNSLQDKIACEVNVALLRLLSEKHLYQSVQLDVDAINAFAKTITPGLQVAVGTRVTTRSNWIDEEISKQWFPNDGSNNAAFASAGGSIIVFDLPTVETHCKVCKAAPPFNPVPDDNRTLNGENQNQWFYLSYLCQKCKKIPIRVLVRRKGNTLTLAGRDPIESIPAPKCIPEEFSEYFADAQILRNAGKTLAGLFLLRVFIEQFWRTIPEIKEFIQRYAEGKRPSGDELGERYQKTLRTEIKESFPSLRRIYQELSDALHAAKADEELFERCHADILTHFDAIKMYERATRRPSG